MAFSVSDVKNIGELSGILVIPLICAACYTQFGWWAIRWDESIIGLMNSDMFLVSVGVKIAVFVLSVFVTTILYFIFNALSAPHKGLRLFLLLSLITYGVLGLGSSITELINAKSGELTIEENLYFNLAALVWGFDIFYSEPNTNKRVN
ncbi:hypothetical protein CWI80_09270 [Pseudidiomarina sediminum]|uniref:DUF2569 domain-containing protein n=1 Tax=Pseudidiomarina sediminum TaxID=431675 RepID=A0A432Z4A3_9GAMM|nr:hypothetical protein [Pseudidiomarina sediminum]RUO72720.1 hypothetical protein CWI80_09270 [Pseudidiomarina sediminum]